MPTVAAPPPWLAEPAMGLRLGTTALALRDHLVFTQGDGALTAERITNDTRHLRPGDAFVALTGTRDGHIFVPSAFARGARFAIVSRWPLEVPLTPDQGVLVVDDVDAALATLAAWWRGFFTIPAIGIGGGVGKTTTKETTAGLLGVLAGPGAILKTPANWNDRRGLSLSILGLRPQHRYAVLEMGMDRPGEVAEIAQVGRPTIGLEISIAATHLANFPDMATLVATEAALIAALPADGLALLNADDRLVRGMAAMAPCPVRTFGTLPGVDLRGIRATSRGTAPLNFLALPAATAEQPSPIAVPVQSTLLGRHLVTNVLGTLSVALALGWDLPTAAAALATVQVPQRIQVRQGRRGSTIIDDTYNASPASMLAALNYLTDWPRVAGGRRIAVLGTMRELGSRSAREHHRLGRRAAARCDLLYATGEEATLIAEGARAAGIAAVHQIADPAEALTACAQVLQIDDIVLIKASHAVGLDQYVHLLLSKGI